MDKLKELFDRLDGYKTYLAVSLLIVIEVLNVLGYLDNEVATSLEVFMGAGGLAALRAAK